MRKLREKVIRTSGLEYYTYTQRYILGLFSIVHYSVVYSERVYRVRVLKVLGIQIGALFDDKDLFKYLGAIKGFDKYNYWF